MAAPGQRKKMLTQFTNCTVCIDGYNAHLLQRALDNQLRKNSNHTVVIGHPKALSRYSIQKLEEFIEKNKKIHHFTTYSKQFLKTT